MSQLQVQLLSGNSERKNEALEKLIPAILRKYNYLIADSIKSIYSP